MEVPLVRPGKTGSETPPTRVVAYFYNASQGNMAIQLLTTFGVPSDRLGVVTPERLPTGQGMLLSIPCPDARTQQRVEAFCRSQGAEIHEQRSGS
jgi:hypothetical protein